MVIHAYINEMHGSRSKIPGKNIVRQRCAEGFNFGVKGLIMASGRVLSCPTYRDIHQAFNPIDIGVILPPGRRSGRKADYFSPLPLSSKGTWSHTFTPFTS
jgi:hypothetical protein